MGRQRPVVDAVRGVVQPAAIAAAEVLDQPGPLARGHVAHRAQAQGRQLPAETGEGLTKSHLVTPAPRGHQSDVRLQRVLLAEAAADGW